MRHLTPELLSELNGYRLSKIAIELARVADLSDPESIGIKSELLWDDRDLSFTRGIGHAAFNKGFEGLLVPSATRLGTNLVIFPDNLADTSVLRLVSSRDPRLHIQK